MIEGEERTVGFFDVASAGAAGAVEAGDGVDRSHLQRRLDAIAFAVGAAGGIVIKQIGDELMCALPDPATAVALAVELQTQLERMDDAQTCFLMRAGIHHGPVVEDAGDLFGDTVNIAARLTAIASPGQIITTDEVYRALSDEIRRQTRVFDEVRIKGSRRRRVIYRVLWAPRAETLGDTQMPVLRRARESAGTLTLHHADRELRITDGDDEVRLGRDARCELVVASEMASRFHAIVAVRSGKFVLRDQSTNGTWVRMQGSPVVTIRREEIPLFGEGIISLGEAVGGDRMHLIRFTCF